MKKQILAIALALALALTLASCNLLSGNSTDSGNSAGGNGTTKTGGNGGNATAAGTSDLTTIPGYLASFGFTEDDLKLPNFTRFDADTVIDTGEVEGVNVYVSVQIDTTAAKTWFDHILSKLKSLADDGQVVDGIQGGAIDSSSIDFTSLVSVCAEYTYQGKTVDAYLFITAGMMLIDNSNPNDASSTASLKFDWSDS